jgi:hypothetical protein
MNPYLLARYLFLAASVAQGMGSVAGVIQLVGYVAAGAMLISAGLSAAGERSIGSLKTALVLAGVAAGAFAISTWLFSAFGGNINVTPQTPN